MIPRIVHQTWKDDRIPDQFVEFAASWSRFNPSWRRILWTDRMLLDFIAQDYPDLLDLYRAYPHPVCRADAARYMLLHKFGGLYADIDMECVAPLASLESEERVVLCHEPPSHWPATAPLRSHPFILFNGAIASPAGHPFWREALDRLPETQHGRSVIDIAGPCFLTGVYLGHEEKDNVAVHSCHLFTPTDKSKRESPPYGAPVPVSLTRHHWAGSWLVPDWRRKLPHRRVSNAYHRLRYCLKRGATLDANKVRQQIGPDILRRPHPKGDRLAIFVPVPDATAQLDAFVEAISRLDISKEMTKLVFCTFGNGDEIKERLRALASNLRQKFAKVVLLNTEIKARLDQTRSSNRRREAANVATARNYMIDHGLEEADDWVLWTDVRAIGFPADILQRLRAAEARIIVPNCVEIAGGPSCDMSSFVDDWHLLKRFYHRHVRDGLFQPPLPCGGRLYLSDLRHSERVDLDGVGSTALLVDASLHRTGLRFPEIPYWNLIYTEGFGVLARDLGVQAVGLPRLEVIQAPE